MSIHYLVENVPDDKPADVIFPNPWKIRVFSDDSRESSSDENIQRYLLTYSDISFEAQYESNKERNKILS